MSFYPSAVADRAQDDPDKRPPQFSLLFDAAETLIQNTDNDQRATAEEILSAWSKPPLVFVQVSPPYCY